MSAAKGWGKLGPLARPIICDLRPATSSCGPKYPRDINRKPSPAIEFAA